MTILYYDDIDSALGRLRLVASDRGLRAIYHEQTLPHCPEAAHAPDKLAPYVKALEDYLAGHTKQLTVVLELTGGTELQRRVWQALQQIPYGETITYSDLAQHVGRADAVRAVASACGKNPLPIIIPCHRVLAKDGSLGGFAWGLPAKQTLLGLESASAQRPLAA